MNQYFEKVTSVIEDSLGSIDEKQYEALISECMSTLQANHKIIASGLGKNVPICEKFVGTMLSLGMNASFMHTNTAVHGDLGMVREGDLVIILTKSGSTAESILLAKLLNERKTNIWLFSFNEGGKLVSLVDKKLILRLENEGDLWDIVPNNSTTVYLIVLQAIAIELAKRLGITRDDFKVNHPGGAIGEQLAK